MGKRHVSNKEVKAIARRRMGRLLVLARDQAIQGDLDRARRYVDLARRVAMRGNVPMPYGAMVCPGCHTPFLSGRTCRVRLRSDRLIITCHVCGQCRRLPYAREKKEWRACQGPKRTS
jgi:ribonuclease P protein subunit RPR2